MSATRCYPSMMATLLAGTALLTTGCASEDYARLYHTESLAPSLTADDLESLDYLGAMLVDQGVNFSVYSENATRLEILLFDDPDDGLPSQQFEMVQYGDLWNLYVEGIGHGQHYGYVAWGANWPYDEEWSPGSTTGFLADVDLDGNRFNPNKLLIDPYARAIHRDHEWALGSTASGPKRYESTYAAAAKGVIVESRYEWSDGEGQWLSARADGSMEGHAWNELVLYEVHPKGFTANPASGVDHPGTFRGIGEMASYLADLGITAVELLPVHEKPLDGGYWGYSSLNFFAPELSYSASFEATGQADEILDEFKWMVDQLHQVGVEVIIDVVYNHTGEGGLWREQLYYSDVSLDPYADAESVNFDPKEIAGLYSFRGLDNSAYYALSEDNQTYWNNTGVGNQTRPNHTPMRRLILDSLRFQVEELHVDGFRFDLAGILGEQDLNFNEWDDAANTVLQDIIDDPVLLAANTRIIAEPWTAGGNYGSLMGAFPTSSDDPSVAWAEWNAHFRDWWRSYVNDDEFVLQDTEGIDGGAV
ncbi:MAG: alpha-amylase family glycosyl hydrolase, partial [Myxococcota bacterium]|nr:alpha-amylase family glycosyl hydrolase [Myxococcota bacterium]